MYGTVQSRSSHLNWTGRAVARLLGETHVGDRGRAMTSWRLCQGLFTKGVSLRVVEAGASKGSFLLGLASRYPRCSFLGIEIDGTLVNNIKELGLRWSFSNVEVIQMDLCRWEEKEKYDLIVCSHVLEHISEDRLALSNFCRALAPGGFMVLQVPEDVGRPVDPWERDIGHVRSGYTLEGICEMVAGCGFTIDLIERTWGLMGALAQKWGRKASNTFWFPGLDVLLFPLLWFMIWLDCTIPFRRQPGNIALRARKPVKLIS